MSDTGCGKDMYRQWYCLVQAVVVIYKLRQFEVQAVVVSGTGCGSHL